MDFRALTPARFAGFDQGADFTGPGPIRALADGVVTRVESAGTGWPGQGAIIVYRLTSGPQRGRYVYVAEDLAPGVRVGQSVRAGEVLGQATGSGQAPGIEAGFAQDARGSAYGTVATSRTTSRHYGAEFGAFVESLKGGGSAGMSTDTASENWGGWTLKFLRTLGVPVTADNVKFTLGWLKAENPASAYAWNPLATTLRTKSATRSGGVQAYKDELGGLQATVQTIQGGQYSAVRRALAKGDSSQATWDALRASPWDAGHYAATPTVPSAGGMDATRPVVGSKKGGGGGVLDTVTGAAGDIWGLAGVSGLDVAGGAASSAASAVANPVAGAVGDAASAVGTAIEGTAIRIGYILAGLLLGGFALVLVVRTVSGSTPSLPGRGGGGGAPAAAGVADAAAA